MKLAGVVLLFIGLGSLAVAGPLGAPEITPASASSALALISGVVLVMSGRRRKSRPVITGAARCCVRDFPAV